MLIKRIVALLLILSMVLVTPVFAGETIAYKGDADGDGVISTVDARIALRIACGVNESTRQLGNICDMNGDKVISVIDVREILRMATGLTSWVIKEDDNDIVLSGLPVGSYTLRYEDANGVMSEYDYICTLTVEKPNEEVVYDGLISKNCAPYGAVSIGVYSSTNEKVSEISLDTLKITGLGEKQYSFAAISDTHIGAKTSEDDLKSALQFFESSEDIEFTTVCGDLTLGGTVENLNTYKSIVKENTTKPVYAVSGNHETNAPFAPLSMDSLKPYTEQDLYYSFEKNNDVYIMLGLHDVRDGYEFAEGELQWLYEVLEENRNKRCFVFCHLYPRDGSGDAVDLDLEGDMLNNTQGAVFYSLLSHYSNVLYFHGHSHESFSVQLTNEMNNYDNIFGCHSIHIPSLAYPKKLVNGKLVAENDASEGYVVDVYENGVVLKGRDFVSEKYLPIASYYLDTTLKTIEPKTYYDPTGTILNETSNVLKSGGLWYSGSLEKAKITQISFVDEYNDAYDECWDPTMAQSDVVTVYRNGTELFIAHHGGSVNANMDSVEMFAGFSSLVQINSFYEFDGSRITKMEAMFKDCSKLKELDFNSFASARPENMKNVFYGCSSLKRIDLSVMNFIDVNNFQNMCNGCSSLEEIEFPRINNSKTLFLSSAFSKCTSLKTIDMTQFTGTVYYGSTFSGCKGLTSVTFGETIATNVNNMFLDCSSIENIDVSNFDFSKVTSFSQVFKNCTALNNLELPDDLNTSKITTMRGMFYKCGNLTLDCSDWETDSLVDIVSFNEGAPNVVAPIV